jgi:hypothetical protein
MLRTFGCILVILAVFLAGCTDPLPEQTTGSVQISSVPPGAGVYLNSEYRGTTPVTLSAIPSGTHTLEIRREGYERWSAPVTVGRGGTTPVIAELVNIPTTLPVTFAPTASPTVRPDLPQIHVDGYWTYPPERGSTTTNPVLLLVHAEAFNVGYADAREVTVSANLYHDGRMVCWNTIYLGTLKAGGHLARDSMVSCTLPLPINSPDLTIRFENLVVRS